LAVQTLVETVLTYKYNKKEIEIIESNGCMEFGGKYKFDGYCFEDL
jgi:hypothetical protein